MSEGVFGYGKTAILTEKDKAFIDLILSGIDKYEAFEKIYPEKVKGRTKKQVGKSIGDLLNKKKCREYKESRERQVEEALEKEVEKKAKAIVDGIMEEEELMLHYSNIARDEEESTSNRLRALDSLAKYRFQLDKKQLELQGELQQVIIVDDFEDDPDDDSQGRD